MHKRKVTLKVKQLAEAKGLSDLALAHLAQVDVRVIRRMYASDDNIYLTQLAKVAEALDCSIAELIAKDNKTPDPSQ